MNAQLMREIGHELYDDLEFALRFIRSESADADTLMAYFTNRGASPAEAIALAQAYLAGCNHMTFVSKRELRRSEAT